MKVLIACEFSGTVRDAFAVRGHNAWSCDLLPTETPGQHIQDNVLDYLNEGWDLMIAHPPCTRLTNSGVRWLAERDLWDEMAEAARFFLALLNAPILRKAIENPIPHKYAMRYIQRPYDQLIQPWQFGHGETKATCLWLDGLPRLRPTCVVEGRTARIHTLPPTEDRWKLRSMTYQGIADAMADQWGNPANWPQAIYQLPLFAALEEAA